MLPVLILVCVSTWLLNSVVVRRYEMSEKVDRGVEPCYWRLSYRRRMIRTLWLSPILCVILAAGIYKRSFSFALAGTVGAGLFAGILIQAAYNYKKWKEEETVSSEEGGS